MRQRRGALARNAFSTVTLNQADSSLSFGKSAGSGRSGHDESQSAANTSLEVANTCRYHCVSRRKQKEAGEHQAPGPSLDNKSAISVPLRAKDSTIIPHVSGLEMEGLCYGDSTEQRLAC